MDNLKSFLNEAKTNYWFIYSLDSDGAYLVAADTLDNAKQLVGEYEYLGPANTETLLKGVKINDVIKKPTTNRILIDSDTIKLKGE